MNDERLFVPLKTEYYRLFESGEKKYELRGINDQFNSDTVWVGREVELRRGYSTNDSLWGEISEVQTFESYNELRSEIESEDGLQVDDINPVADEQQFFEDIEEMLGKYDSFICFRVDVDF